MLMITNLADHTWTIWLPLIAGVIAVGILGTFNAVSISPHKKGRASQTLLTIIFTLCIIYTMFAAFERLVWISCSDSYPEIFANKVKKNFSAEDLLNLQKKCKTDFAVKALSDDQTAVRCGYWWPTRKVWLINSEQYFAITRNN